MSEQIQFISDMAKLQDLRYRNKPVIAQFYTEWCPPCKPVRSILQKELKQGSGSFTLACINCDESDQLNIQYQIEGVPTVMVFSCGQKLTLTDRIMGYDQNKFKNFIEKVKKDITVES